MRARISEGADEAARREANNRDEHGAVDHQIESGNVASD
jgi:hypothetical protein